ncbi:MAG: sensor histidine kinase, partial [bacterium]|nr:sensor histidine kinase [bacterium]
RVKNNMQVVVSLLRMQARRISDQEALAAFNRSQDRIAAMALIHETLHRSEDLARISCRNYVERLVAALTRSHLGARADLTADVADLPLHIDQAVPVGLIVNELVCNAFEHAFPAGGRGAIRVAIQPVGGGYLELVVSDDGSGLPEELDPEQTDSLGLQIVSGLARRQLQGTLDVCVDEGARFTIRFKSKSKSETKANQTGE